MPRDEELTTSHRKENSLLQNVTETLNSYKFKL